MQSIKLLLQNINSNAVNKFIVANMNSNAVNKIMVAKYEFQCSQ